MCVCGGIIVFISFCIFEQCDYKSLYILQGVSYDSWFVLLLCNGLHDSYTNVHSTQTHMPTCMDYPEVVETIIRSWLSFHRSHVHVHVHVHAVMLVLHVHV